MGSKYLRTIAVISEPLEFWRDTSEQYIGLLRAAKRLRPCLGEQ